MKIKHQIDNLKERILNLETTRDRCVPLDGRPLYSDDEILVMDLKIESLRKKLEKLESKLWLGDAPDEIATLDALSDAIKGFRRSE